MPEGGGGVDAGVDVTGAGVVAGAVDVGLGDEDGLDTGLEDGLDVGVAEDSTLGARFGDALGDGRKDPDGLDVALGDEAEPVGQSEVPLAATSASVPDAAQPSSVIWWLDTTRAFSSAGIHVLFIVAACGA